MVIKQVNRLSRVLFKRTATLFAYGTVVPFLDADVGQNSINEIVIFATVDHILKYEHTVFIAVIIEQLGFNLDMLSEHIKAKLLHTENVKFEALGSCRKIYSVTKVTLIEKTVAKNGLSVKTNEGFVSSLFDRYRSESKIGFNLILAEKKCEIVEVGIIGCPESWLIDFYLYGISLKFVFLLANHNAFFTLGCINVDANGMSGGGDSDASDIFFRHALAPNGLPDTRCGGIPHSTAILSLLSVTKLDIKLVDNLNTDKIFALVQMICYVKAERKISTNVVACKLTVYIDVADLVDCTEMKQYSALQKCTSELHLFFVNVHLTRFFFTVDA